MRQSVKGAGLGSRLRHRTFEKWSHSLKKTGPAEEAAGWQRGDARTCETGILPEHIKGRGPEQQEDINDAALRHPADICLRRLSGALQVV